MLTTHTLSSPRRAASFLPLPASSSSFTPLPRALGTGRRALEDGRYQGQGGQTVASLFAPAQGAQLGEPSTCRRAALCVSRFGSQACPPWGSGNKAQPQSIPVLSSTSLCGPSLACSQKREPEMNCFPDVSISPWLP